MTGRSLAINTCALNQMAILTNKGIR